MITYRTCALSDLEIIFTDKISTLHQTSEKMRCLIARGSIPAPLGTFLPADLAEYDFYNRTELVAIDHDNTFIFERSKSFKKIDSDYEWTPISLEGYRSFCDFHFKFADLISYSGYFGMLDQYFGGEFSDLENNRFGNQLRNAFIANCIARLGSRFEAKGKYYTFHKLTKDELLSVGIVYEDSPFEGTFQYFSSNGKRLGIGTQLNQMSCEYVIVDISSSMNFEH